jgi:hypothetical protein
MRRTVLKFALAAAAVLLVSGCATGIKHDQMAASMPNLKQGDGRIYFFRSTSMMGAAIQPDIRLNGQVVGQSKPGGFFFVDRPAGNYVASASTETEKTVSFTLAPGEIKYVRSSMGLGVLVYRAILELETPEKARAEIGPLSYTGTPLAAK